MRLLLRLLPPQRMLKMFGMLRTERVNNARTRRQILASLLGADKAIAALLHDAVEDRGGRPTLEGVWRQFGDRVAAIVEGCTDAYEEPQPEWRPRKEAYIRDPRDETDASSARGGRGQAAQRPFDVSDLLTSGAPIFDRFRGGKEGTLWYYRGFMTWRRGGSFPG